MEQKAIVLFEKTAMQLRSQRTLHVQGDACHPGEKVVDTKRMIGKNVGQRRRRGTRGRWPPKKPFTYANQWERGFAYLWSSWFRHEVQTGAQTVEWWRLRETAPFQTVSWPTLAKREHKHSRHIKLPWIALMMVTNKTETPRLGRSLTTSLC
jgi:hypothetical protein